MLKLAPLSVFVAHLEGCRISIKIKNRNCTWPTGIRVAFIREGREPTLVFRSPGISRKGQGRLFCWVPKGAVALQLVGKDGDIYTDDDLNIVSIRRVSLFELGIRVGLKTPRKLFNVFRLLYARNQKGESFRFARAVDELNALPYAQWLRIHQQQLDAYQSENPLPDVSVLVTYDERSASSSRTLASLEQQTWPHWKVVSRAELSRYESALDQRHLWCDLPSDYVLAPNALEHMIQPFASSEVAAVYADEDHVSHKGDRYSPVLKPAWSPLLAKSGWLSVNGALLRLSSVPPEVELQEASGAETVIAIAASSTGSIVHLPRVLLSSTKKTCRRSTPQKTSTVSAPPVKVTVVIPTRDREDLLSECIRGLQFRTADADLDIIIIDNDSKDQVTLDFLRQLEDDGIARTIFMPGPFNFSRACNIGVEHSRHEMILLLNNDVDPITPDWLVQMANELDDPTVGAVGAYLFYPDGLVQHAGVTLGAGSVARHSFSFIHPEGLEDKGLLKERRDVSAVTGACLLTTKTLWNAVGGMDEPSLPVAFNDVDYCLKLRQMHKRVIWTPYAKLWHHESVSRGKDNTAEKLQRFAQEEATMHRRWGRALRIDPFHNPNLSKVAEDFVLETFPESLAARTSL